jgi:hypothetical protein
MAKHKKYVLRPGMVLERKYRRQVYKLLVVKNGNHFQFKLADKTFPSLSAAAKHLVGEDQEISGPAFWGAKPAQQSS